MVTNLDAERLPLISSPTSFPPELRRSIELVNGQMAGAEVRAVEVKQYADDEARHQTVVPCAIGNTEVAKRTERAPSTPAINRASLVAAVAEAAPRAPRLPRRCSPGARAVPT